MRVVVALEPDSAEAAQILGEWWTAWGAAEGGGGELDPGESLSALLDLKGRCFARGITVNASFPDNHRAPSHG